MRVLVITKNPVQKSNETIKDGGFAEINKRILEEMKPEAAYFLAIDGQRSGIFVVDLDDASQIPALAEPFFLNFEASVDIYPVMTVEDLARAGIDDLGKKWG